MIPHKLRALFAAALVAASAAFVAPAPAQAGAMSDYLENKLIDHVFRGQAYTAPATQYVALATSAGSDVACGTEVSGNAYARVGVASSLANWAGTQSAGSTVASSGTSGTTSNNTTIAFPTPTATWGNVVEVCVYDAASAGNLLWRVSLGVAKTINTGDVVDFPAASLSFQNDN